MTAVESGRVVSVTSELLGDSLAVAATAGDVVLFLNDAGDFDELDGGTMSLNGEQIAYTAVDDDADTITLVSGISADADVGERVDVWDLSLGEVAREYRALVELPGSQANDDTIDAAVAQSLAALLPEGLREPGQGESVTMQLQDLEWVVTDVRGKRPQLTPSVSNVVTGDSSGPNSTSIAQTVTGGGASVASAGGAIAIGTDYSGGPPAGAQATANNAIAIGGGASAASPSDTVVGLYASTDNAGGNSVAIGRGASVTGDGAAVAVGTLSLASALHAVAIGKDSEAAADSATALGYSSYASGASSIAIGNANAAGDDGTAVGDAANASAAGSTAVGTGAQALDTNATSLGKLADASAAGSVAIGCDSTNNGAYAAGVNEFALGTANHIVIVAGKLVIADGSGGLHQIVVSTGGALSTVAYP